MALGNLFRRRGEVDKAIRIHQNLIARPTLTKGQRATAMMELARDYLRAGVLDRAEGLFKDLQQTRSHAEEALRSLLAIYEQEREWESAIATARRLEQTTGRPAGEVIAHYYCELSEQAGICCARPWKSIAATFGPACWPLPRNTSRAGIARRSVTIAKSRPRIRTIRRK